MGLPRKRNIALGLLLAGTLAFPAAAGEWQLTLDPESTSITFKLDASLHTVEGSFTLESGELHFTQGSRAVSGTVTVDARSGTTGIGRRDRKMHSTVLDSELYPDITFRAERVLGEIRITGSSSVLLRGVLTLHGDEHIVTMPVTAESDGEHVSISAALAVPYVEWGMSDPSAWYLRVAKEVFLLIESEGNLVELTP